MFIVYEFRFHQSIENASSMLKEVSLAIKAKIDEMKAQEEAREKQEEELKKKIKDKDEL
jgi:hypothetical protein